jgi:16S rRNA (guanine(966)-N(2))-methyltransferase RsmD
MCDAEADIRVRIGATMTAMGVRVTGGRLRGRRLRCPARGVRPTSDRVREALFARLGDVRGMAVLDLYAGTGVLGAEAVSRGASSVVFVERAARCLSVLRTNLEALALGDVARVVAGDVSRSVRRLGRGGERFDLVLLDPPYGSDELRRALEALRGSGVLAVGARVVVEHGRRHPLPSVAGLHTLDARRYGDTMITCLTAAEADGENGGSGRA